MALVSVGLGGAAAGATLTTPPLSKADAGEFLCLALNAGRRPVEFTMEIRSHTGVLMGPTQFRSDPGQLGGLAAPGTEGFAYCRITGRFAKRALRLSFCTLDASDNCLGTVTAP